MDSNSIATLKDYQSSIENQFKLIDKNLSDFDNKTKAQKEIAKNKMNKALAEIKNNLKYMEIEMKNIKEEKNEAEWMNIYKSIQKKTNEYKQKVNEKKGENNDEQLLEEDYANPDAKVNLGKLTTEQAMIRGDKILDRDDEAIANMEKMVHGDVQTMKQVNIELDRQDEKLQNANKDLTEIDYDLKRAGKKMKDMLKMYATDKLIMCLIIIMLLVIVTIIIISILKGNNDDDDEKDTPKDIFD